MGERKHEIEKAERSGKKMVKFEEEEEKKVATVEETVLKKRVDDKLNAT